MRQQKKGSKLLAIPAFLTMVEGWLEWTLKRSIPPATSFLAACICCLDAMLPPRYSALKYPNVFIAFQRLP
jgi:hypothetical protein